MSLEPLISITHEQVYQEGGEVWLQCNDRLAEFFWHHPFITKILTQNKNTPDDAHIVLDITKENDCPSIQNLMVGGKRNATQLFCNKAHLPGKDIIYDGRAPRLYFSEEEKRYINLICRSIPKKKIAIQIKGGHWWKKYVYLEKLIKLLKNMDDTQIFLTNDEDIPFKHQGTIPLVRLGYRDLMLWLGAMDLVIGLDSSITHIAGAIGTQTYGIFGPTDPEEILGMYGAHVHWNDFPALVRCPFKHCWLRPCKDVVCLRALSPYKVLSDIKKLLSEGYENPRLRVSTEKNIHLPLPKQEYSGVSYSTQATQSKELHDTKKTEHPQIALMRLDGLGGTLTLSDQAKKVKEATGAEITLIIRHYPELFDENPYVDHIITVGKINWDDCLQTHKPHFTALADIRMAIGKWYDATNIFYQDFTSWERYYEQFPLNQQDLAIYGLHHIQLTDKILGLPFDTIDSKIYFDLSLPEWFSEKDYICICPGIDTIHEGIWQTKKWHYWNELVKKIDMPVVQLGTKYDERIDGTIDLRGKTTIQQVASILSHASVVVAIEGGLMHLAYAVGQKNVVVLFGPTAGPLFLYPSHIHIDAFPCRGCFATIENWPFECKEGIDAVCMKSITQKRVVYACNRLLGRQSNETVVANTGP